MRNMSAWTAPELPARWTLDRRPVFVGRQRELEVLDRAWTAVTNGARQAIFVGGEPGAGKTRLIAELCVRLEELGGGVLLGTCVAELGPPYQPFEAPVGALRAALLDGHLDGDSGATDGPSSEVLADRLGTITGRDDAVRRGGEPSGQRETFDAVTRCLRKAADQQPLVVVLDDLHWAGPTALQLLAYVVEHAPDSRLLVIGAHRTTSPDKSPDLVSRIAALYRLDGVRRMDLTPLDTEDITEFLVGNGVPRREAGPAAVVLRDRTGGNPFFLCELWEDLLRLRRDRQLRPGAETPTPDVVRDSVRQRTAGLSPAHRDVLGVAAVIGEEFDAETLLAIVGNDDGLPALDAVLATGLLQPVPDLVSTYRFTHALARRAVLDGIPSARRARDHERVGTILERRGAPVEQLAHHFEAAHLLGHADKAVGYLGAAAEVAEQRLAHSEAARLHRRAARLAETRAEAGERTLAAARSHHLACEFALARELLEPLAATGGDDMRLRAAIAYEEAAWPDGHSGQHCIDLLSAAVDGRWDDASDPQSVRALAGLARATAHAGEHGRAEVLAARAIALARDSADVDLLGHALAAAMQIGFRPGVNDTKRVRAEELTQLAGGRGQGLHLGPAAFHRLLIAYQDGDRATLAAARGDLERVSETSGQRYWSYLGGFADVSMHLVTGHFAEAQRVAEDVLATGESFGDDAADGPYGVQSFMIRRETGGLEPVRRFITGHEDVAGHWPPALLALYTGLAMKEPATRVLHHILHQDVVANAASARWPGTLAFVAEAAVSLQDREAAEAAGVELEEFSGLNLVMGPMIAVFGAADRYLAALDSLLGRGAPGERFAAALELDTRTGSPLHQAHTLLAWSAHARRAKQVDLALTLERRARDLGTHLGLRRVVVDLDARRSLGPAAAIEAPDGLTDREIDVLRLLGEGLSNRLIARRLVISENTAANHVRSILMKTGCANRTQAAMYASTLGLLRSPGHD